jgi:hypothetical protein
VTNLEISFTSASTDFPGRLGGLYFANFLLLRYREVQAILNSSLVQFDLLHKITAFWICGDQPPTKRALERLSCG